MPESMTPQDENRILDAVEKVAGFVDLGMDPNDAVVKAAQAVNVPRGHVRLIANAYNIGRTRRQQIEGAGPLDKVANFPLVDLDAVYAKLYPGEVKAAAVTPTISTDYARGADWYKPSRLRTLVTEKAAAATPAKSSALTPDPELEGRKVLHKQASRARVVSALRGKAAYAQEQLLKEFSNLGTYFKTAGALRYNDVVDNVAMLHGERGRAVMNQVARVHPKLVKAAAWRPFHEVDHTVEPYRAIKSAVDWAEKCANMWALFEAAQIEADTLKQSEKQASIVNSLMDKTLGTGVFHGATALGQSFQLPESSALAEKYLAKIGTPDHEQKLRAIQAQTMLHELLNNDEILSGHDPYDVAHHYNRLSQLAPQSARQPAIATPAVRKAVQQGTLDSFDTKELADTEHKLRSPGAGASDAR